MTASGRGPEEETERVPSLAIELIPLLTPCVGLVVMTFSPR
jgi:hypothetical protein